MIISCLVAVAAVSGAPLARADIGPGNWELHIPDRFDFHTWLWAVRWCGADCRDVAALPQPVAKAYNWTGRAHLTDGRWTLEVNVPDGLRCGNVYYGPTLYTHDVYSWDAESLTGSLQSSFDVGCDGQPGSLAYPIAITRL
jgi:hypothetical protein